MEFKMYDKDNRFNFTNYFFPMWITPKQAYAYQLYMQKTPIEEMMKLLNVNGKVNVYSILKKAKQKVDLWNHPEKAEKAGRIHVNNKMRGVYKSKISILTNQMSRMTKRIKELNEQLKLLD